MLKIVAIIIFVLGYVGITFEHKLKLNKSAFALLMGSLLWVVVSINSLTNGVPEVHVENVGQGSALEEKHEVVYEEGHEKENSTGEKVREFLSSELVHSAAEIFEIVIFLLAAMSLVEVLVEYQFFDLLRGKILSLGFDDRKQFIVITILAFFLSAVIDNLTTTIVMVTIAKKFFKDKNLILAVIGIVIAANAGGAFSPLGDVTTILLWLAGKFESTQIILRGFLPSLAIYITAILILVRQFRNGKFDIKNEVVTRLTRSERVVVVTIFGSFALPFIMSMLKLPPYLGLLIGLGLVWTLIDVFKQLSPRHTHIEASIERMLQKTDLASLKFFIGVLLAVSALNALGLLNYLSDFVYGADHDNFSRVVVGNIGLGFLSAILDNVPLTAITIKVLATTNTSLWILLAITVGTGGSLLSIGSAAGVIAMGMVKEITFGNYIKYGFIAALVSYLVGVGVWFLQYTLLGAV